MTVNHTGPLVFDANQVGDLLLTVIVSFDFARTQRDEEAKQDAVEQANRVNLVIRRLILLTLRNGCVIWFFLFMRLSLPLLNWSRTILTSALVLGFQTALIILMNVSDPSWILFGLGISPRLATITGWSQSRLSGLIGRSDH